MCRARRSSIWASRTAEVGTEAESLPAGVSESTALTAVIGLPVSTEGPEDGEVNDLLFSLQAARDALNVDREHGPRIAATGSNRDKLSMLRASKDRTFFGAPLATFPPLGRDYVQWLVAGHGLEDEAVVVRMRKCLNTQQCQHADIAEFAIEQHHELSRSTIDF